MQLTGGGGGGGGWGEIFQLLENVLLGGSGDLPPFPARNLSIALRMNLVGFRSLADFPHDCVQITAY